MFLCLFIYQHLVDAAAGEVFLTKVIINPVFRTFVHELSTKEVSTERHMIAQKFKNMENTNVFNSANEVNSTILNVYVFRLVFINKT